MCCSDKQKALPDSKVMLSDFLFSLLLFFSFLVVMTYFFRNFNSSLRILNSTYLIVYLFLILLGDIIILFLFSMMVYSFSLIITVTFKFFSHIYTVVNYLYIFI